MPGLRSLVGDHVAASRIAARIDSVDDRCTQIEALLDGAGTSAPADLEATNAALIRCKDAAWAIGRDRLRAARQVASLAEAEMGTAGLAVLFSVHQALSALDRLEVRGRDSAGLEIQLVGHGLDPEDPVVAAELRRRRDRGFGSGSVRLVDGVLVVVYKAAAEIGELGDNTAVLRDALRDDTLLRRLSPRPTSRVWCSATPGGPRSASSPSPTPTPSAPRSSTAPIGPFVTAVLNGDVDNFADLNAAEDLQIAAEITTDAKVIPTLMARRLAEGDDAAGAFRETVAALEGSVAIAATTVASPDRLLLALRGSGQALYVGLADDAYIVAWSPTAWSRRRDSLPAHGRRDPGRPRQPDGQPGPDHRAAGRRRGDDRRACAAGPTTAPSSPSPTPTS